MPTAVLNGFVDHLRRGMPADPRADGELVRVYVTTGSEAAFAELVRRFSPLVWGVCRRAVHDRQLAEDAFQATFLVLIRKAGSVRPNAVGGWLHAVAVHTSTRARAMADRRKSRTRPLADHDPTVGMAEPTDADAVRALDEEVSRLPESLRAAVVLCELGGVSRKEAAERLGIAEGTLSSRLASARKRLAVKLRGRGIALAVAVALLSRTADAAPVVSSATPETVSTLADGAVRTMFLSKLKLTAVAVLAVVLAATGGGLLVPGPAAVATAAPVPKGEKEGAIVVGIQEDGKNRIEVYSPKGEKLTTIPLDPHPMYHMTLSRGGKRVAVWAWDQFRTDGQNRVGPNEKIKHTGTLLVYDVDSPEKPLLKLADVAESHVVFTPDGASMYLTEMTEPDPKQPARQMTHAKLDLATQKKTDLKLPPDHFLMDVSPDGKTLLTVSSTTKVPGEYRNTSYLVPLDTLEPKAIGEANVGCTRFSPDGRQAIGRKVLDPKDPGKTAVVVVDVKTGKEAEVKLEDDTYMVWNTSWAPDGKRVLVQRDVLLPGAKPSKPDPNAPKPVGGGQVWTVPDNKPEVAIRDLDGSNPKPVLELKKGVHIFGVDWR